jgi:predicted DNA-binding ribbon-helix-helix protein
MRKRSVTLRKHRTSISLEDIFWKELQRLANAQKRPLQQLIEEIDRHRSAANLSSALRTYVVEKLKEDR